MQAKKPDIRLIQKPDTGYPAGHPVPLYSAGHPVWLKTEYPAEYLAWQQYFWLNIK
jgi:hypothetical protein